MTHGGLLSIMEATSHAVPLIVLPIFAEQDYNAGRVHDVGYGIRLEIVGITQNHIQSAIKSVLEEPKY
jgi:UDP:flavonoid glycosyltransferase YjiC (YdhE family)